MNLQNITYAIFLYPIAQSCRLYVEYINES